MQHWLLGAHHGGWGARHAQACLDELAFRFNRRLCDAHGQIPPAELEQSCDRQQDSGRQARAVLVPCIREIGASGGAVRVPGLRAEARLDK